MKSKMNDWDKINRNITIIGILLFLTMLAKVVAFILEQI